MTEFAVISVLDLRAQAGFVPPNLGMQLKIMVQLGSHKLWDPGQISSFLSVSVHNLWNPPWKLHRVIMYLK